MILPIFFGRSAGYKKPFSNSRNYLRQITTPWQLLGRYDTLDQVNPELMTVINLLTASVYIEYIINNYQMYYNGHEKILKQEYYYITKFQ